MAVAAATVVVASEYVECAMAQFVPLAVSWENCCLMLTVLGLQRRLVMKWRALMIAAVLAVKLLVEHAVVVVVADVHHHI